LILLKANSSSSSSSQLSESVVNASVSVNVTVTATYKIIVTSVEAAEKSAKKCVDEKSAEVLKALKLIQEGYAKCKDPNATTTAAPITTTAPTTAAPSTVSSAPTVAPTTAVPTTTIAASTTPCPCKTKFSCVNVKLILSLSPLQIHSARSR
jgi:hypothetical protein